MSARARSRPAASIALLYLTGATLGAYTLGLFSVWCLAIPLAVLVAAAFVSG